MININLNPWREKQQKIYERQFWVLFIFVITMVLVLWYGWSSSIQVSIDFKQNENIILKNEIAVLDSRLSAIASLKREKQALIERLELIQSLHQNRSNTVDLLSELARGIPDGLVLTDLVRENDSIIIEGKAESNSQVAQLMRNIENISLLKTPVLSVIQANDEEDTFIEFNLKALQSKPEEAASEKQ